MSNDKAPAGEPVSLNEDKLKIELERAYRCIQGMHSAMRHVHVDFPGNGYHALIIAAAKRFVFEGALDGAEYFIGKPASVLHDALRLDAASLKGQHDALFDQ